METLFHFVSPPGPCGYLPDETWQLEHEIVGELRPDEYEDRLLQGWRRFGNALFRPRCHRCRACQSLRVDVGRFRPDRSQRRVRKLNDRVVDLRIGKPAITRAKLDLYDRYHAHQADAKGWPFHDTQDVSSYHSAYVDNPIPTQEWCYYLGPKLVGVGYVDDLPGALSAIYFFYDPDERQRSLGTWNVLSLLDRCAERGLPYLYLGYYVAGCGSMEYKRRFVPNQVLQPNGRWVDLDP